MIVHGIVFEPDLRRRVFVWIRDRERGWVIRAKAIEVSWSAEYPIEVTCPMHWVSL